MENTMLFLFDNYKYIMFIIILTIMIVSWSDLLINRTDRFKQSISKYDYKDIKNITEKIKAMEEIDFEMFCKWLLSKTGKYKKVQLNSEGNNEEKDIILTDYNGNKIYVQCKNYIKNIVKAQNNVISRGACQKFVGIMISDNIKKGIIITTGNIQQNAKDYVNKIEKNTDIEIDIIDLNGIIEFIKLMNKEIVQYKFNSMQ